jgi:two-component system cell cycle sensor histidine kinase/response regulator CckA
MPAENFIPNPLRILHLEDDPADVELIHQRLTAAKLNPQVILAQSQKEFSAALQHETVDLILADVQLRGFDGFQALDLARSHSPDVPFIFVSGSLDDGSATRAIQLGAADYVLKDDLARLGLCVRRTLHEAKEYSARRRAEEALRASENQYRLLFENNPTPVFVFAAGTLEFLAVNPAALQDYGYSPIEFLGMNLKDLALGDEIPAFLDRLTHLAPGTGTAGIWRHRRKDGKLCEMEITAHSLIFAGKQAWLALAFNVTERLNLEAQLRQSQKMESVGQLAGGIAHDFNNLLTVISGHAGLLLAKEKLAPNIADPLKEIYEAAKRAADLTRQLLTFSRKQHIQPQVVDLNEVVNNITKMLRRVLGEDIALEVNFSPSLPSVKADLGMVEQVLINLAVNSRDAMPKGGHLHICTFSEIVDKNRAQKNPEAAPGRFVCLTFADTGCGIPPENLARIFEPFFTTKEINRGTGLGLATVYGIVKQHQGWIEVTSEVGRGATFKIFLPATNEISGAVTMPAGEPRVIGGTETILVVEDEAPLLRLIHHILESHGYKVLDSQNGKTALELWGEHRKKIDLLFTDMILPDGMTGPELAEILKTSKPGLKVIYTSGYDAGKLGNAIDLKEGRNFIQKPFHARKLAETVYDCLNAK